MSTDPSTGLSPLQLAYCFGFRASAANRTAQSNPYLPPGANPFVATRPSDLADAWHTGWLNGQGKRECDLAWYIHACQGGD